MREDFRLWPESGEVLRAGKSIADAAGAAADILVTKLPEPSGDLRPPSAEQTATLLTVLDSMTQKIPEMIVVCKLLGDALPKEEKD